MARQSRERTDQVKLQQSALGIKDGTPAEATHMSGAPAPAVAEHSPGQTQPANIQAIMDKLPAVSHHGWTVALWLPLNLTLMALLMYVSIHIIYTPAPLYTGVIHACKSLPVIAFLQLPAFLYWTWSITRAQMSLRVWDSTAAHPASAAFVAAIFASPFTVPMAVWHSLSQCLNLIAVRNALYNSLPAFQKYGELISLSVFLFLMLLAVVGTFLLAMVLLCRQISGFYASIERRLQVRCPEKRLVMFCIGAGIVLPSWLVLWGEPEALLLGIGATAGFPYSGWQFAYPILQCLGWLIAFSALSKMCNRLRNAALAEQAQSPAAALLLPSRQRDSQKPRRLHVPQAMLHSILLIFITAGTAIYAFWCTGMPERCGWEYDSPDALATIETALRKEPRHPWNWILKAEVLIHAQRYGDAWRALDEAATLMGPFPHPQLYAVRARAFQALGQFDAAIAHLSRAIELDPHEKWYYHARGHIYALTHCSDQALLDYNQALALDPLCEETLRLRSEAYAKQGDITRAIEDLQNSFLPETVIRRAKLYFKQGKFDSALADLQWLLEILQPLRSNSYKKLELEALVARADVCAALHRYDEALKDMDRATVLDPDNQYYALVREQILARQAAPKSHSTNQPQAPAPAQAARNP